MPGWLAALAALLLLAGCEELPTEELRQDFPFNGNVEVSTDLSRNYFNARIRNATSAAQEEVTFEVALFARGVVMASGSTTVGPFRASETRSATLAFGRQTLFECFRWSLVTAEGRRRSADVVCL